MACLGDRRGGEPLTCWQLVDAEQLSEASITDEEVYSSCEEGDMVSELDVTTECTRSLYARLRARPDTVVRDLRCGDERDAVLAAGCTLAVFLLFQDGAKRKLCWCLLQKALRVSADAWLDAESEHMSCVDGVGCECDGVSLVLLLRLETPLSGCYTAAELDRKVEALLGCPAREDGGLNVRLGRCSRISYEVVPVDTRDAWVARREEVLGDCVKCVVDEVLAEHVKRVVDVCRRDGE